VTNVALRKRARVANLPLAPVMAFIDTSETMIGVEIAQNDARDVVPGQDVELTFKFMPGTTHRKGRTVLQAYRPARSRSPGLPWRRRRSRPCRLPCASGSMMRSRPASSGRQHRRDRDLHRPRKGRAPDPQGPAAADRDPELRPAVLSIGKERPVLAGSAVRTITLK
jgi:hypothetical protein